MSSICHRLRNFGALLFGTIYWVELSGCARPSLLESKPAIRSTAPLRSSSSLRPNLESINNAPLSSCRPRDYSPSRAGFLDEALFAEPTPRTSRFDDYTPNSYHVEKQDLFKGLIEQASTCRLKLRAILIVGPLGMLWTYHIATFVDDGNQLRVNFVAVPHARITEKRTALISGEVALRLLADISISTRITPGQPNPSTDDPEAVGEFAYNLLLVRLDGAKPSYWHAKLGDIFPTKEDKEVFDYVTRLVDMTTATYRHGDPVSAPKDVQ